MKDVNELTVCRDEYKSQEDFENAIKKAVMVLLENDYIMTVKYDDKDLGVVVIHYNYADESYGCDYPHWLSPEEIESVVTDEQRAEEIEKEE